jgi:hypothetical protein
MSTRTRLVMILASQAFMWGMIAWRLGWLR